MEIQFAVEFEHDANILGSLEQDEHGSNERCCKGLQPEQFDSYLAFLVSFLTLEQPQPSAHLLGDEQASRMRQKMLEFKEQVDALDRNDENYYVKKEDLIFKVFCEYKGIPYEVKHIAADQEDEDEVDDTLDMDMERDGLVFFRIGTEAESAKFYNDQAQAEAEAFIESVEEEQFFH
ncbi:uncharacterized protein LOC115631415 [Scaptodrosophila lebanonensis]|uniref:Uncharacterized protein LOC115631415 n=1 Tax=Drosophila lebanonensis TaxID=7225 RepID=A0A6J2U612_DROLE|nr:uncharacterized protein LOC115631415 [Scaptodrosophila lebanonensis]